jgi:lipopolysaccharide transport system ATP-binding protein
VSHNIAAVKQLCKKGISLSNGKLIEYGLSGEVIKNYIKNENNLTNLKYINSEPNSTDILSAEIFYFHDESLYTEIDFELYISYQVEKKIVGSIINFIFSNEEQVIWQSFDTDTDNDLLNNRDAGLYRTKIKIPAYSLKPGTYNISIGMGIANSKAICQYNKALSINILASSSNYTFVSYREDRVGAVPSFLNWETIKIR